MFQSATTDGIITGRDLNFEDARFLDMNSRNPLWILNIGMLLLREAEYD
jgi:hypothetical protein